MSSVQYYQGVFLKNHLDNLRFPPPESVNELVAEASVNGTNIPTTSTMWVFTFLEYTDSPSLATITTTFDSCSGCWYVSSIMVTPTFLSNATESTPKATASNSSIATGTVSQALTSAPTVSVMTVTGTPIILYLNGNNNMTTTSTWPSVTTTSRVTLTQSTHSTTSAVPSNYSVKSKISTGGTVGIAAGCIFGVVLVAVIVAWSCLKRRRRGRTPSSGLKKNPLDHGYVPDTRSLIFDASAPILLTKQLPQPVSDQTVRQLVNRTLDSIELYVETYYEDNPSTVPGDYIAMEASFLRSPYLDQPVTAAIRVSSTPTVIFKHCIAHYLLQKIAFTYDEPWSLLPKEFIMFGKDDGSPNVRKRATLDADTTAGNQADFTQQRAAIAHLQPSIEQEIGHLSERERSTLDIVERIEHAFHPWARGPAEDRVKNLRGILTHLSELGRTLFAQAAKFEWRWTVSHILSQEQIVMLPGLDKIADSSGVTLEIPIKLVKPRIGRLCG